MTKQGTPSAPQGAPSATPSALQGAPTAPQAAPTATPTFPIITPLSGAVRGGYPVEIEIAESLVAVEWVKFGDNEATDIDQISYVKISVTSPEGEKAGPVDIKVKTYHIDKEIVLSDAFTYT